MLTLWGVNVSESMENGIEAAGSGPRTTTSLRKHKVQRDRQSRTIPINICTLRDHNVGLDRHSIRGGLRLTRDTPASNIDVCLLRLAAGRDGRLGGVAAGVWVRGGGIGG